MMVGEAKDEPPPRSGGRWLYQSPQKSNHGKRIPPQPGVVHVSARRFSDDQDHFTMFRESCGYGQITRTISGACLSEAGGTAVG